MKTAASATTKSKGDAAEDAALAHLQAAGLKLLQRNYRTPGRGGGEIDLIMRDTDGTLVFVEVRQRAGSLFGGAAASISLTKRNRIIFAAKYYLMKLSGFLRADLMSYWWKTTSRGSKQLLKQRDTP